MATTGASLQSIYDRLSSVAEYHPFNADTFSDWSMEAGDLITVKRDGNNYTSPVHSSELSWKGQSQIRVSSDGNESRESISKATKRKYARSGSGYRNDSHLRQELVDTYNGLYSYFEVTASRMHTTFEGLYDGLSSSFEVTRSRMYVDFQGAYDGLSSSFEVTRSRMYVDFQGAYDGLSSSFEVTRSLFHVELVDSYNQLSSGIEAAASYTMMYAESRTSRAEIIAKINKKGQSEVDINAENISIGTIGSTKINLGDAIGINGEYISLKKKTRLDNELMLSSLRMRGSNDDNTITPEIFAGIIKKAELTSNNTTLTLTTIDGREINFSKAVTLSGAWDNGNFPLTINATQTNGGTITNVGSKSIGFTNASDFYLTIEKNGDPSAFGSSRKLINVPYKIVHHGGTGVGDQDRYFSSLASVDATSVYNNGWDDVVLNDPDWQYPEANHNSDNTTASNSVVVKASDKSDGSIRQKAIPIALTVDTANKKAKVTAGGYVRAIANIDMKTNAEYNTAVANAGYAGRAAVTISDTITWGTAPSSGISVSSNSIKVSTAGRTTSDGTIQQSEKTINLYTQSSTSGLTATFYVTHTNSTNENRILKKTATCSDSNLVAGNIKKGVTIFGVAGNYTVSHSPTISSLTYHGTSDPGSAYEKRQVNVDNASEYYKFTANCGGQSKNYALYVNNRAYSSSYDAGFKAGWKAYYNDSTHWQSNYYNSNTGKYEAWVPSSTVTKNSSGQWVGSWDSSAWFSYTNVADYSIGFSAPENSSYYISNSAPGNSITDFTSGATRLYNNKWVVNGYHYKFKVTAGSKSRWFWFRAGT